MRQIADAARHMTSRELAHSLISLRGDDAHDRKLLSEVTRRASKALRKQRDDGRVRSAPDENGNLLISHVISHMFDDCGRCQCPSSRIPLKERRIVCDLKGNANRGVALHSVSGGGAGI